jgi:hypothetical protein
MAINLANFSHSCKNMLIRLKGVVYTLANYIIHIKNNQYSTQILLTI